MEIQAQEILNAINSGETNQAIALIQQSNQRTLSLIDFEGRTLLMHAARQGNLEVIECLINQSENINLAKRDRFERNVFYHALESNVNTFKVMERLLEDIRDYENIACYHDNKDMLFSKAIDKGDYELVELMLARKELGDNVDASYQLLLAMQKNNLDIFAIIYDEVDQDSIFAYHQQTEAPLLHAFKHKPKFFKFLCENDTKESINYFQLFDMGIETNNLAGLRILLRCGKVNINLYEDGNAYTPLRHAIESSSSLETIEFLIDNGADINDAGIPLFLAIQRGRIDVIRLLLVRGAKPNIKNEAIIEHAGDSATHIINLITTARIVRKIASIRRAEEGLPNNAREFYQSANFDHDLANAMLRCRYSDYAHRQIARKKILDLKLYQFELMFYASEDFDKEFKNQIEYIIATKMYGDLTRLVLSFLPIEDFENIVRSSVDISRVLTRIEPANKRLIPASAAGDNEERQAKRSKIDAEVRIAKVHYNNLLLNQREILLQLHKLYDQEVIDKIIDLCANVHFARNFIESVNESGLEYVIDELFPENDDVTYVQNSVLEEVQDIRLELETIRNLLISDEINQFSYINWDSGHNEYEQQMITIMAEGLQDLDNSLHMAELTEFDPNILAISIAQLTSLFEFAASSEQLAKQTLLPRLTHKGDGPGGSGNGGGYGLTINGTNFVGENYNFLPINVTGKSEAFDESM